MESPQKRAGGGGCDDRARSRRQGGGSAESLPIEMNESVTAQTVKQAR